MVSNPFSLCFCFRKSSEELNEWDLWQKTEEYSEYDSCLVTLFTEVTCCMVHIAIINDNLAARISKDAVIWSKWLTISKTKIASNVSAIVWNERVWCFYFGVNKRLYYCSSKTGDQWIGPEKIEIADFTKLDINPKNVKLSLFEHDKKIVICIVHDEGVHMIASDNGNSYRHRFSYPTNETKLPLETVFFNGTLYQSMVSSNNSLKMRSSVDGENWKEWRETNIKVNSNSCYSIFNNRLIQSVQGIDNEVYIRYSEDGEHWTNWSVCGDDRRTTNLPVSFITKNGSPYLYQTIVSLDNFVITRKISYTQTLDIKFMIDNTYANGVDRDENYFKELIENFNHVEIKSIGNDVRNLSKVLRVNNSLVSIDFSSANATGLNIEEICLALSNHKRLKKICFDGNQINGIVNGIANMISSVATLTEIDLSHNRLGDKGTKNLFKAILTNPLKSHLEKINLSSNGIEREGAQALKEFIIGQNQLRSVVFNNNDIQNEGCIYISEAISVSKSLITFELSNNGITMKGVKAIGKMLSENNVLEHFTFSMQNAKRIEGMRSLCHGIATNKKLISLDLSSSKIGSEGTSLLVEALSKNSTLLKLNISNNDVEDEGLLLLAKCMKENATLTHLNLSINDFRRIGTSSVASAITFSCLSDIDLSGCSLSQGGVKALCISLRNNNSVEKLNLNNCRLGDADAQEISSALLENKTLKVLEMDDNKFEAQGLISISEMILQNPPLQQLSILGSTIMGLLAKGFANALASNTNLSHLKIQLGRTASGLSETKEVMDALVSKNNIELLSLKLELGKSRLSPVIALLKANSNIKHIALTDSKLIDRDATSLATMLSENNSLESLDLRQNKIGSEGAMALASSLQKNSTLKILNLDENDIGYDPISIFSAVFHQNKAIQKLVLDEKYADQIDISFNVHL